MPNKSEGSTIELSVVLNREGLVLKVVKDLPIWLVEQALVSLDHPSESATGFDRMLCSSSLQVQDTMRTRKEIAKALSAAIVEAMGAGDTRMGYPLK